MKPNMKIGPEMLDNAEQFNNDFFSRFTLRKADAPLKLTDTISKDYSFPTFYGDVSCGIGVFLCSYERAAELVARELHPAVKPIRMPKGRALTAFSCYEYKKVMGVAPYNEIAMTIPIMVNPGIINPPVLPMIMGGFPRFGYYVFGMPVTSEENRIRGNKIWGLPKVTQEIDIFREGGDSVAVAKEENGDPYITLRVPVKGNQTGFDVTSNLYTKLDGTILQCETNFKGEFAVTKNIGLLLKQGATPDREYLTIGDGPSAEKLRFLEIEPAPFQFRYAEGMSSCFDLPAKDVPSWLKKISND